MSKIVNYFFPKDFTPCGPEKGTCIANQTLKDKDCLVHCEGLHADIVENSERINMVEGRHRPVLLLSILMSGLKSLSKGMYKSNFRLLDKLQEGADYRTRSNLEALSEEWSQDNKNLQEKFLQMFPNAWDNDETSEDVMKLTKAYPPLSNFAFSVLISVRTLGTRS